MIFCRVECDEEDTVFGEGLNPNSAFNDAKLNANYEFSSNCSITFWDATKMQVGVKYVEEIFEY